MTVKELGEKIDKIGAYLLGDGEDFNLILENEDGSFGGDIIYFNKYDNKLTIERGDHTYEVVDVIEDDEEGLKVVLDHSIYDTEWGFDRSSHLYDFEESIKNHSREYLITLNAVVREYIPVELTK